MTSKLINIVSGRFLKNPNFASSNESLSFCRDISLNQNVKELYDPISGKKVTLIGTMNVSNLFAQKTKNIIENINPDTIYVQTTNEWYLNVLNVFKNSYPKTNEEIKSCMPGISNDLNKINNNFRNLLFKAQLYPWLMIIGSYFGLGNKELSPFLPGLESFLVTDYAHKNSKKIIYTGKIFNSFTINILERTKSMYLIPLLYHAIRKDNSGIYLKEKNAQDRILSINGLKDYAEIIDDNLINWWIAIFGRIAPVQKSIFVDQESERIFKNIYENKESTNIVALVNSWNLNSIEKLWKLKTNSNYKNEFINPIGDFNINLYQNTKLINETLRRIKSKTAHTEPASSNDYLYFYNKSQFEGERERHVFFEGYNDSELEHGLYNEENKNVKNLPYKISHHH